MNKISILIIIIIFLVVTNVATIVSVSKINKPRNVEQPVMEQPREFRIGFVWDEINFTEEQRGDFVIYNRDFNERANMLSLKMSQLRQEMVDEMASESPDTALLEDIISEFGDLHVQLKQVTMEFYFNLKGICDNNQQERLYYVFRDMLDPDGQIYGRGRGGYGRGIGRRQMDTMRQGRGQGNFR